MAQTFITAHSSDASTTDSNPQEGTFHGTLHITFGPSTPGTSTPVGTPVTGTPATAANVQQLTNGAEIKFDSTKDLVSVNAPALTTGVSLNPGTSDQQSIVIHNMGTTALSLADGSVIQPSSYQGYVWGATTSTWSKQ